jgi:hypothetical protein
MNLRAGSQDLRLSVARIRVQFETKYPHGRGGLAGYEGCDRSKRVNRHTFPAVCRLCRVEKGSH